MATPMTREWVERGICRTSDNPDLWFPNKIPSVEATIAKDICQACPVRHACLEESLQIEGTSGIWGGLDDEERKVLQRRRRQNAWRASRRDIAAA